jgi:uncharacterized Zn-finger protein
MQTHSDEVRDPLFAPLGPPPAGILSQFSLLLTLFHSQCSLTNTQRPFVCTWEGCGKGFKRATHLNRHMMVHQQLFPFKCTWEGCERAYVQKCQLDKHVITHTTPKPYACTWEGCSESFSKHNKLRRHICTHTGALPYPCSEPNCTVAFNHPSHLKRHIASVHQRTSACHHSIHTFCPQQLASACDHCTSQDCFKLPCYACSLDFSHAQASTLDQFV